MECLIENNYLIAELQKEIERVSVLQKEIKQHDIAGRVRRLELRRELAKARIAIHEEDHNAMLKYFTMLHFIK